MIILYHMGFYQPYFQESKVWIQFYQNLSFGVKILTIQSLKIPCDPYKIHTQSSFHTKIQSSITCWLDLGSSIFSSSSSSSPLLSSLRVLSNLRPNLVFKIPCLLRPCLAFQKPIFGLSFIICKKVLQFLAIYSSISFYCILASNLLGITQQFLLFLLWPIVFSH